MSAMATHRLAAALASSAVRTVRRIRDLPH
jgi:hypothetical protein